MARRAPTCLSTEKHDDRVLDVTLHYFGCLKASEHQNYFATLSQKSQKRIEDEKLRIHQRRSYFEARPSTKAGSTLKNFKATLSEWRRLNHKHDTEHTRPWTIHNQMVDHVERDVKASVIYFKDSKPYDVPELENVLPNQKVSVADLLSEDEDSNPLIHPCGDGIIRYFHLPANNMHWVEVAHLLSRA